VGIRTGEHDANAPGIAHDDRSNFQQLQTDRIDKGCFERYSRQRDSTHRFDKRVGKAREQRPELVWPPLMTRGAIGKQSQLLSLDAVFHLTSRTVQCIVEILTSLSQIGNDEARVAPLGTDLRLEDDASMPAPEAGCVVELKEWPLLALAYVILLFSQLEHRCRDTLQTLVLGDADNVANNNGSADSKCAASYSRTIIGTFAYVPGAAWMVIFAISVTPSQEMR